MPSRVLVVEDEDSFRLSTKAHLRTSGFEVEAAADAQGAFDVLEQMQVDVVLLDIRLPGMDGTEALRKIVEEYPETDVMMMTGFADFASALACLKAGARDYLVKPFDTTELVSRLNTIARSRASERALKMAEREFRSILYFDFYGSISILKELTERLLAPGKDAPTQEYPQLLMYARELSSRMASKIAKLVDFSGLESEVPTLNIQPVDIGELTTLACARHRILARLDRITIEEEMGDFPPTVDCDPEKTDLVLNLLLQTMVRVTYPGSRLSVGLDRTTRTFDDAKKECLHLWCQSAGSRLHDEDLGVVFHNVLKSHPAPPDELHSAVLALATARRIIEAHGGAFWVGPKVGGGLRLNFALPLGAGAHAS